MKWQESVDRSRTMLCGMLKNRWKDKEHNKYQFDVNENLITSVREFND